MAEHYLQNALKHITRFGDRIVSNWEKSSNKSPGGDCYSIAYERAKIASRQVGDVNPMFDWDKNRMFCAIWGSHYYLPKWLQVPDMVRGRGAPGAMVWDGRATRLLESDRIWAGALEPGAVIQTWRDFRDYIRVYDGKKPVGIGHSFFHHSYAHRGSSIIGMKIIDQNASNRDRTVTPGEWAYWVAANVRCLGPSDTYHLPDPWFDQPEAGQAYGL